MASIHQRAGYLRDAVFGADDGIITTFAVVAGSAGASLGPTVVLILGFANLFADGFSMAAGTYLGVKSEIEFEETKRAKSSMERAPFIHGLITFLAFNIAGLIPLAPFVLKMEESFVVSTILVGMSLFAVGFLKSIYARRNFIASGIESFLIGGVAAFVAYIIGFLVHKYIA